MEKIEILRAEGWEDYELLDAGDEEKLERFEKYVLRRPEPKALWRKTLNQAEWEKAVARYERSQTGGGRWIYRQQVEQLWKIGWKDLVFAVSPTGFKHMGVFPEQAALWSLIRNKVKVADRKINVLNLFAYTGGCTLAAAVEGASVTHIDAAKEVLTWARENARLSKLENAPIRWIPEDAMTFVRREINRNNKYDAIIVDAPKFGRGTRKEVWKMEDDLQKLVELCVQTLSPQPLFVILNAYAVSYSSITLANMLEQVMENRGGKVWGGELATQASSSPLLLPNSIFGVWEGNSS